MAEQNKFKGFFDDLQPETVQSQFKPGQFKGFFDDLAEDAPDATYTDSLKRGYYRDSAAQDLAKAFNEQGKADDVRRYAAGNDALQQRQQRDNTATVLGTSGNANDLTDTDLSKVGTGRGVLDALQLGASNRSKAALQSAEQNVATANDLPQSKTLQDFGQSKGFWDAAGKLVTTDAGVHLMAESATPMARNIAVGAAGYATGGLPAAAVAVGGESLLSERASKVLELAQQTGKPLSEIVMDERTWAELQAAGNRYAAPVAAANALSLGAAKYIAPFASRTANVATQAVVQPALAGAGEAGGQINQTGKIENYPELAAEMLLEVPGGLAETAYVGGNALKRGTAPAPEATENIYADQPAAQARPAGNGGGLSGKIIETANALGMNPVDLATIISYETAGTFDPAKRGPTTQWGQHKGFIQFGEPQAKEYGVDWNDPINSQLGANGAVAKYFRASGWKPGMSVLDAYSIVNAGAPGKYNASDANNGGASGTVRDKVENQFAPHRSKAEKLLGGEIVSGNTSAADPAQSTAESEQDPLNLVNLVQPDPELTQVAPDVSQEDITPAAEPNLFDQFDEPAPTVQPDPVPVAQPSATTPTSADTRIRSEDGQWHAAEYQVVEADALQSTTERADNQFRDRNRTGLTEQVRKIAGKLEYDLVGQSPVMEYGAPVVGQDGAVIAGNGRLAGIQLAYNARQADDYKARLLEDAPRLGIDTAALAGMKNPVLVRRLKNAVDTRNLAALSNEGGSARMSPLEQARVDAERIGGLHGFQPDGDGNITQESARVLMRQLLRNTPQNQHNALQDSQGMISQEGIRRVQNAVLHMAYGDSPALSRLVETADNESRNVLRGLNGAAPALAEMRDSIKAGGLHDADIVPQLVAAVEIFTRLKARGAKVQEWLSQIDAFNEATPEIKQLLAFLDRNTRRPAVMREMLVNYANTLKTYGAPNQNDMFGAPPPTKSEVLNRATQATEGQPQTDLFGGTGRAGQAGNNRPDTQPTETAATGAGANGSVQKRGDSNQPVTGEQSQKRFSIADSNENDFVKPIREAHTFTEAREAAKAFQGKPLLNADSGIIGVVSRNSLDKMLSGKAVGKSSSADLHSMVVANIDALFDRAVLGWAKPDRDTDPNITQVLRFFAPMVVNGKAVMVKLTVKETARSDQNNKIYTVEAVELNEETPAAQWVDSTVQSDGIDPTSIRSTGDVSSIAQDVESFNKRASVSDKNSAQASTTESVRAELRQNVGKRLKMLERSGKLVISENPPANGVAGSFSNGVVTLYPDNIKQGDAWGVFLHEAGEHAGLQAMLGDKYQNIVGAFNRLLQQQNQYATRAVERVPGDTNPAHVDSERLAYLIEYVTNNPNLEGYGRVKVLVNRIVAAVRAWAVATLPVWAAPKNLTPQDIQALAVRAARAWADGAKKSGNLSGSESTRSKNADSENVQYSIASSIARAINSPSKQRSRDGWLQAGRVILNNVVISPHEAIRDIGTPSALKLADMLRRSLDSRKHAVAGALDDLNVASYDRTGEFSKKLEAILEPLRKTRAGLTLTTITMSKKDRADLVRGLHTGIVPVRLAPAARQLRAWLDEVRDYQLAAGLDFGLVKNYFPRNYDTTKVLDNQPAFIAMLMKNGYSRDYAETILARIVNGDSMPEMQQNASNRIIVAANGQTGTFQQREGGTAGSAGKSGHQQGRVLDIPYDELAPFLDNNLEAVLTRYLGNAIKRAEYARAYGANEGVLNKLVSDMVDEMETMPNNVKGRLNARQAVELAYDVADMQQGAFGNPKTHAGGVLTQAMLNMQVMIKLPLAVMSSIPEFITPALLSGNTRQWLMALVQGVGSGVYEGIRSLDHAITKTHHLPQSEMYQFAEDIGVNTHAAIQEAIDAMYFQDDSSTDFLSVGVRKFMRLTMQEQTMRLQKAIATKTFLGSVRRWAKNTGNKHNARMLQDFGIDPVQADTWAKAGFPSGDPIQFAINRGAIRFATSAITTPDRSNRSRMFQYRAFGVPLMLQFSSFSNAFGNTLLPVIGRQFARTFESKDEAIHTLKMIAFMVAMMGVAFAAQELRDWWKFGDKKPYKDDTKDDPMRRVFNSFDRAGFTGMFSKGFELVSPYKFGYGQQGAARFAGLLGPAAGDAGKFIDAFFVDQATAEKQAEMQAKFWVNEAPLLNALPYQVKKDDFIDPLARALR